MSDFKSQEQLILSAPLWLALQQVFAGRERHPFAGLLLPSRPRHFEAGSLTRSTATCWKWLLLSVGSQEGASDKTGVRASQIAQATHSSLLLASHGLRGSVLWLRRNRSYRHIRSPVHQ